MFSTASSSRAFVSRLIFSLGVLTFPAIIPDTFAQTPNAPPVVVLVALPGDEAATRPRRVTVVETAGASSINANEIERRAFDEANAAREKYGLQPLTWDVELCRMARDHSEKMVRQRFFSHQTPDGLHLKDRARAAGLRHFQLLGENIAYNQGFEDPGAFAVATWMRSPGHRANILNPRFERSAIGVFVAADGTVYLTQEFMSSQPMSPSRESHFKSSEVTK